MDFEASETLFLATAAGVAFLQFRVCISLHCGELERDRESDELGLFPRREAKNVTQGKGYLVYSLGSTLNIPRTCLFSRHLNNSPETDNETTRYFLVITTNYNISIRLQKNYIYGQ
jgi:hypothetical protein